MTRARSSAWWLICLLAGAASSESVQGNSVPPAPVPPTALDQQVRQFAGARTKAVWCRQAEGSGEDFFARGTQLQLWGYDSDDGRGPRVVLDRVTNYNRPIITTRGDRVVFNDFPAKRVQIVNWDGSGRRDLADGIATDVWRDPATGNEWVYMVAHEVEWYRGSPIVRFRLDDPTVREVVWDRSVVTWDNVQLSADGTRLSGQFPHPDAGFATVPNGSFTALGKGCWTSIAPDNSYLVWLFDGPHRNLQMHAADGRAWTTNINGAPAMGGFEVYHPRWSNHVRYFTVTGPYQVGKMGDNLVGAGGPGVEIYLGRFTADFAAVEQWLRLTEDSQGDFFPDLWIEGGELATSGLSGASAAAGSVAAGAQAPTEAAPAAAAAGLIRLEARLIAVTPTPSVASIAPYTRALVAYTYEVTRVLAGDCRQPRILVAHWAIRDRQVLDLGKQVGGTYVLEVEPFEARPELEGERLLMDTEEFHLPLYYEPGP